MTRQVLRLTRWTVDGLLLLLLGTIALLSAIGLAGPALDRRPVVISGPSMEPAIGRGALVFVRVAGGRYQPGEIVTVALPDGVLVTHRITRTAALDGVPYLELKGDANQSPDPVLVPVSSVTGRVDLAVPFAGYLLALLKMPSGIAALLAAAVFLLLLAWLIDDLEAGKLDRSVPTAMRLRASPDGSTGPSVASAAKGAATWNPRPGP